ncbi:hypothetical protein C8R11_102292 [Nitrosomonas aestuarii]|nr:hypothetical protein C8R11_102292 [Nitrosomonas aestuarii]
MTFFNSRITASKRELSFFLIVCIYAKTVANLCCLEQNPYQVICGFAYIRNKKTALKVRYNILINLLKKRITKSRINTKNHQTATGEKRKLRVSVQQKHGIVPNFLRVFSQLEK